MTCSHWEEVILPSVTLTLFGKIFISDGQEWEEGSSSNWLVSTRDVPKESHNAHGKIFYFKVSVLLFMRNSKTVDLCASRSSANNSMLGFSLVSP